MIDGKKKFIVAILTITVFIFKAFFGKDLNIDVDATTEAVVAVVAVGYMIAQAVHDIYKEKTK